MRSFFIIFLTTISLYGFSQKINISYTCPQNINAGDSLEIKLNIEKGTCSGFAKCEIYLPVGFQFIKAVSKEVSVIYRDNLCKLIWIDISQKTNIPVSLKVVADKRIWGKKEFYGTFHYLTAGNRNKINLPVIAVDIIKNEQTAIPENLLALYNKKQTITAPTKINNYILYRVQIGAFRNKVSKEILEEFYQDNNNINEEYLDGFYKYTIGDFKTLEEARSFRSNCGVVGAFVVRYENGARKN